jgi:hypothetical protein
MAGAVISIFINLFLTLIIISEPSISISSRSTIFLILAFFILLSIIGTILYQLTKKKYAGIIAIIGFMFFVPIGFIGALSIRKVMDEETRKTILEEN